MGARKSLQSWIIDGLRSMGRVFLMSVFLVVMWGYFSSLLGGLNAGWTMIFSGAFLAFFLWMLAFDFIFGSIVIKILFKKPRED